MLDRLAQVRGIGTWRDRRRHIHAPVLHTRDERLTRATRRQQRRKARVWSTGAIQPRLPIRFR